MIPPNPERHMTFIEHLGELRARLIYMALFLAAGFAGGLFLAKPVIHILLRPFEKVDLRGPAPRARIRLDESGHFTLIDPSDRDRWIKNPAEGVHFYLADTDPTGPPDISLGRSSQRPVFLSPLDPLSLYFKTSLFIGLFLAFPLILHQVWLFAAPGLKRPEIKWVLTMLGLAGFLFPAGVLFAYGLMGLVLDFLLNFQIVNMTPQLEIFNILGFEMQLLLGFGLVFEFPLAIMFLTYLKILHPDQMRQYRSHAYVVIAFISMIFTPPDPFSMLIMMGPLVILYEASIGLSAPLARRRAGIETEH